MTFLTPTYALLAAAVAVPTLVVLYFLKLRRRDVEISTTLLWKKAIQDLQANAPFQKLRRNILLLLQLLVLGAAILALGQPRFGGEQVQGSLHVIMIDRSASMQGDDGPGSRLDAAKKQAKALVDSMREGGVLTGQDEADKALVIAFDSSAGVLQSLTAERFNRTLVSAFNSSSRPTRAGFVILSSLDIPLRQVVG